MNDAAMDKLIRAERLPDSYQTVAEGFWAPLAAALAARARAKGSPLVVGVNGPQGAGKSTSCRFIARYLATRWKLRAVTFSLDDIYLTRAERARLASDVHPLLATRGVPGTHDLALGHETLSALQHGRGEFALPLFDKASDDRAPQTQWPKITAPVDVILFEGWCMAAQPQAPGDLCQPINMLEAVEDPDGIWRRYVNDSLTEGYAPLFGRVDMLIMLRPPSYLQILEWRKLQERKLIEATGKGMGPAEVEQFVMHFERLTRHMLATMPTRADLLVDISPDHDPVVITPPILQTKTMRSS